MGQFTASAADAYRRAVLATWPPLFKIENPKVLGNSINPKVWELSAEWPPVTSSPLGQIFTAGARLCRGPASYAEPPPENQLELIEPILASQICTARNLESGCFELKPGVQVSSENALEYQ